MSRVDGGRIAIGPAARPASVGRQIAGAILKGRRDDPRHQLATPTSDRGHGPEALSVRRRGRPDLPASATMQEETRRCKRAGNGGAAPVSGRPASAKRSVRPAGPWIRVRGRSWSRVSAAISATFGFTPTRRRRAPRGTSTRGRTPSASTSPSTAAMTGICRAASLLAHEVTHTVQQRGLQRTPNETALLDPAMESRTSAKPNQRRRLWLAVRPSRFRCGAIRLSQ